MSNQLKPFDKTTPARARILVAAIRCIEKFGLEKTTMEEIAAQAGVVRKTVYLIFGNRKGLFDAILLEKLGSNVDKLKRYVDGFANFEEAIVNGCQRHIQLIRKDNVFFQTLRNAHHIELDRYLLGADSPAHNMTIAIWADALQKARARDELRRDVSDTEFANWLLCTVSFLLVRDDLPQRQQADMLRKFLAHALLVRRESTPR